ncbi:BsuPI-related putative proteinase inhibitor [Halobacterium wangiae]|uniref:BsuPI-related putative proteinase inhibitor n=1 Tax=Halobacterium wangiae TaxID=2902623 RepID=UPI001E3ACE9A|nr:BsuPI-related putative proteinase inhibitor [Halobacterium wangiae]
MLDATLAVTTDAEAAFALTVENVGSEAVSLSFRDGQRAEFVVERTADGETIWRWSDDRMFSMAVESDALSPGAATTYEATWSAPQSGDYVARAWLTATDTDVEAETAFVVP